jgi:hypothetical protein
MDIYYIIALAAVSFLTYFIGYKAGYDEGYDKGVTSEIINIIQ